MLADDRTTPRPPRITSFLVTGLLIVAGPGLTGVEAQRPGGSDAAPDTGVAVRLQRTTAHLEQMLRTLRASPALEERWSGEPVLEAAVAAGRRSTGVAREVARLSAALDSLLASEAAADDDRLARVLRRMRADAEELASSLQAVAGELEALRAVAHDSAGAGDVAHAHPGGGHRASPGHTHAGVHFSHPMIAETVTPDTKIRLDHQYFDYPGGERENSGVMEAEYAFSPSFSVEAALPYSYSSTAFGNAAVLLKFANRAFEEDGVILGYGLELDFPTNGGSSLSTDHGHEEGEDHTHASEATPDAGFPVRLHGATGVRGTLGTGTWEIGPYLNAGWKSGPVELMGWTVFGIPFDHADQAEVGTELSWNFSALVHASSRLQPMLELDGSGGISGHAVGEDVVQISPGLKVRPFPGEPLWVGTSVGFPLATGVEEDPFDARVLASLFWHF